MQTLQIAALSVFFAGVAAAQVDDFQRENKNRAYKDALEGQAPPALDLTGWMNTGGEALTWDALRGKVVVIDFWGTW